MRSLCAPLRHFSLLLPAVFLESMSLRSSRAWVWGLRDSEGLGSDENRWMAVASSGTKEAKTAPSDEAARDDGVGGWQSKT
eukprot:2186585-Rhodomonas_salina.2